jgi:hypothetical protein
LIRQKPVLQAGLAVERVVRSREGQRMREGVDRCTACSKASACLQVEQRAGGQPGRREGGAGQLVVRGVQKKQLPRGWGGGTSGRSWVSQEGEATAGVGNRGRGGGLSWHGSWEGTLSRATAESCLPQKTMRQPKPKAGRPDTRRAARLQRRSSSGSEASQGRLPARSGRQRRRPGRLACCDEAHSGGRLPARRLPVSCGQAQHSKGPGQPGAAKGRQPARPLRPRQPAGMQPGCGRQAGVERTGGAGETSRQRWRAPPAVHSGEGGTQTGAVAACPSGPARTACCRTRQGFVLWG